MSEKDKFDYLIDAGWLYCPENGNVISSKSKPVGSNHLGYLRFNVNIDGKQYKIYNHRFGFYYVNKFIPNNIDHINGTRNDNKFINLRDVNNQQNHFNMTKSKGFTKRKSKYISQITKDGRVIYLGIYENESDAREAYQNAKKQYHKI